MGIRVETAAGTVEGVRTGAVTSWKGIPYAAPPVGPLRFAPPRPAVPWTGVRDCTRYGPISLQPDPDPLAVWIPACEAAFFIPDAVQAEDCLNLNVWSPSGGGSGRHAVYLWIHGGAWVIGSGTAPWTDGSRLAASEDIVVVSLNYRLGALGALAVDEEARLGNDFLLDTIAALSWIRENIAAFGGDRDRVTVGGESAGAMMVCALLASPRARDLFHGAIVQSGHGSADAGVEAAHRARDLFLRELGPGSEAPTLERLRAAAVPDLMDAQRRMRREMITPFRPVVDGDVLPLPVIDALNRDEHNIFEAIGWGYGVGEEVPLRRRLERMLLEPDPALLDELTAAYRGLAATDQAVWNLLRTDLDWRLPQRDLAAFHADTGAPVYRYEFDFRSPVRGGVLSASHAMDIPFPFGNLDQPGVDELTGDDGESPGRRRVATQCRQAWGSFVRDGRPSSEQLPEWPRYERDRRETTVIGPDPSAGSDPHASRLDRWREVSRVPPLS
ncbi:MAG TPA: carboxylesterase family protein [Candidatus Dormibacteraeota bacterium]|jgi:para-nitrobenzyl esterase|nr:carboxylesterase family protein [Candidatus Dormibacteraeota bacterium]